MFTRLILRNPFQVARAAINSSNTVSFVRSPEIESGTGELDRLLANLVTKQPARCAVFVARNYEAARQIAQSRDHNQCDLLLALSPADAAHLTVRNERRIGPDTVLVEAAADPPAQRSEVGVVHEHHDLAERVLAQDQDLVDHQDPE